MSISINKERFKFYLWIGAVWLLLWILNSLANHSEVFVQQSLNEIWRVFYIVLTNFIFYEYSLPFIVKKRSIILSNILIGILLIALQFILVSWGMYGWKSLGLLLHIYTSLRQVTLSPGGAFNYIMEDVFYQAQGGITALFFFGLAKLFYDNFKLRKTAQQLRLEMKEAELNYLKSQTNPHFLFNTLNNIYSLARDKSDLTPESILRLSDILRYMLYETSGEYMYIEQELKIINDYIALEKLRYDDTLRVNFQTDIDDLKQLLPPLLLIPLVENAFKHGVSETRKLPFIEILLSIKKERLTFVVKNSTEEFSGEGSVKENIGLSNLRRQLELLYTDCNLSVQQEESIFTATLIINLASHV
ncbi:MAG: histidine kinase [Bacteroidetes bacterium GWF2_49_14]|nr:MAG: histidine kinase [Bacteroidetes bacterium GWF2_49_14]HBB93497.1 histidine kinase [Bacteroidales bacterium]